MRSRVAEEPGPVAPEPRSRLTPGAPSNNFQVRGPRASQINGCAVCLDMHTVTT